MSRARTKRRSRYNPKSNYNPDARREINQDPRDPAPDGTKFGIVPKRAQAVITYKPAARPAFCADCGGRDFWQLSGGRWMCKTCQPKNATPEVYIPPQLNDTQLTALDLYERGFNVIPLKPHEKSGYILRPFWFARLHHCGKICNHGEDITSLFGDRRNIGIITGRTSGNLLDIDCDTLQAFDDMGRKLTARAIPFWAVTGAKGGSYLVRILEGEVINIPKAKSIIPGVEFFGNRHIRVIPPSIHPSGVVYQWATHEPRFSLPPRETIPAVSLAALEWTGLKLQKDDRKQWEAPELFGLPEWAALLSYKNRQNFAGVILEGDRNRVLTAFIYDAAGNNIEYGEAEREALDFAARTGLTRKEALDTVRTAYRYGREPARKQGGGGLRAWELAKVFSAAHDWREIFGRRALTAQAVFSACIERARQEGREYWRASVREVAELSNTNKETAGRMLKALQPHYIKRTNTKPDQRRDAGIYRFSYVSKNRTLDTTCSNSVRIMENPKTQAEQDLFGILGRRSWQVWKHLKTQPEPSVAAIARAIGAPVSSVYRAMKRLAREGIALIGRASDGKYYGESRTDASLGYLAVQLSNGESKSRNRKAKHQVERERAVNREVRKAIAYQEREAQRGGDD